MHPLFFEVYGSIPRQGPGSRAATQRALSAMDDLPARPRILDVGCGTGKQTLDLADLCDGLITAFDLYPPFIRRLTQDIERLALQGRVEALVADMNALPFAPGSFDVVWSEGALYFLGFAPGLKAMRRLLRPDGYVAVSELTWLTETPPEEPAAFFAEEYPAMTSRSVNRSALKDAGFEPIEEFVLPGAAWWDDFYTPMQRVIDAARVSNAGDGDAEQVLDVMQAEIDLYGRFSDSYGYVFYVGRCA